MPVIAIAPAVAGTPPAARPATVDAGAGCPPAGDGVGAAGGHPSNATAGRPPIVVGGVAVADLPAVGAALDHRKQQPWV